MTDGKPLTKEELERWERVIAAGNWLVHLPDIRRIKATIDAKDAEIAALKKKLEISEHDEERIGFIIADGFNAYDDGGTAKIVRSIFVAKEVVKYLTSRPQEKEPTP